MRRNQLHASSGQFMDAFRKRADGNWEMTVIAFNSDLPAEGTAAPTD